MSVSWPNQPQAKDYLAGGPMVAIEVLSPRNTPANIRRKPTLYLTEGGGEVWVADHKRKIMSVYRKVDEQIVRVAIDSTYRCDLLGLTVDLAQMFE